MGRRTNELHRQNEAGQEQGNEITRRGQELNEEASISYEAMCVEGVDDDTQEAVKSAHAEAKATSEMLAQNELRDPAGEVISALKETGSEAEEFGDQEAKSAAQAAGAVGEFADIGAELSDQLTRSSEEFYAIREASDQISQTIEQEVDAEASALEGTW